MRPGGRVFFDQVKIPWRYEPEGYDLGEQGWYLPDFLLYPNTRYATWFEVKGQFPSREEVGKARALCEGTRLPVFVYFAEVALPAPAELTEISEEEFMDFGEGWMWLDEWGWRPYPNLPAAWETELPPPTAFRFGPGRNGSVAPPKEPRSNYWWWWTDYPFCGMVVLKLHGQVGWCPSWGENPPDDSEPQYPRFAHATPPPSGRVCSSPLGAVRTRPVVRGLGPGSADPASPASSHDTLADRLEGSTDPM